MGVQKFESVQFLLELIQVTVGNREVLSKQPSNELWSEVFALASRHAIISPLLSGIEKLPELQRPPQGLLLKWCAFSLLIEERNKSANKAATDLVKKLDSDGFVSCILKGQGIALYYPEPLSRHCGDIDVWLGSDEKKVIKYIRELSPSSKACYHHIHAPEFEGIEVEAHYRPAFFHSPFTDRQFQNWAANAFKEQVSNEVLLPGQSTPVSVPTTAFNLVYLPIHIYTHFFYEGIGLRQLMDFYFVLMSDISETERQAAVMVLKKFRMLRFMSAMMYVLRIVFGLSRDRFLVPEDVKYGEVLLAEVINAGNFGEYDEVNIKKRGHSLLYIGFIGVLRNARHFLMSPSEVFWTPFFKIWHWFWRLRHN